MDMDQIKEITIAAIENGFITNTGDTEEIAKEIATFINTLVDEIK